jgi:hypothetical protein
LEKVGHIYASLMERTVVPPALKRFLAVSGANPDYPAERFAATPTELAIFGMGSRASIGFKFGDEPALLRNLVLPIGDLLLGGRRAPSQRNKPNAKPRDGGVCRCLEFCLE